MKPDQSPSTPQATAADKLSEGLLGFETPIADIETQLNHLWQDQARTRASLMNFAIYEEAPDALVRNSEIIGELTSEHACRGILIAAPTENLATAPSEDAPRVRAWVTAHCQLRGGEKFVCSEQIAFLIHSPDADLVRSTVFAHLDSDLPLIFWWRGEFSERFEERLYSVIDRLIIDSCTWEDPLTQFNILESAFRESGSRFVVNDLSWSRSYHQRIALASLFEDPKLTAALGTLREIKITHRAENRVPALMLTAWIVAQLGLRHTDLVDEGVIIFKDGNNRPIQIRFGATDEPGFTAIAALQLIGKDWQVLIERRRDSKFIHAQTDIAGHVEESFFPADVRGTANLISRVLSRRGMNRLYFDMLPILKSLLEAEAQQP